LTLGFLFPFIEQLGRTVDICSSSCQVRSRVLCFICFFWLHKTWARYIFKSSLP